MKKIMLYTYTAGLILSATGNAQPTNANTDAVKPTSNSAPASLPIIQTAPVSSPNMNQPAAVIDCKYNIPATTTVIDENTITAWAKKAAVQSFEFNPATVDTQLTNLKDCYTEQGWQGFNDALQKSGNINAIKDQHLSVSSQVNGPLTVKTVKDNQWKVTVPMEVVYQNEKEKLNQLLDVDLLIGRKVSGDLGIMQMVAVPQQKPGTIQSGSESAGQPASTQAAPGPTAPTQTTPTQPANTPNEMKPIPTNANVPTPKP